MPKKFYDLKLEKTLRIICIGIILFSYGCSNNSSLSFSEKDRNQIDSTVSSVTNIDSLKSILKTYTNENNILGEIVAYRELGKQLRDINNFTEAIKYNKKGVELAEEYNDTIEIIRGLNNIGTNYRRLGILDVASEYHYNALTYCDKFNDKTSRLSLKNRVISLNGIGNVELTLGNKEAADSAFREALKGEKYLGSALGQAINYANIGSIFETEGRIDSSWVYYHKSMYYNVAAKSEIGISLCHGHYGQLYEKEEKWDRAILEYNEAYNMMSTNTDRWHWLEGCLSLAQVYIKKGDLASAGKYLDSSLKTAKAIGSLEHISRAYHLFFELYNKQGNCRKALDSYILSHDYGDSISNTKNLEKIQEVRINYERARKQNEIDHIQKDYQNEKHIKNAMLSAFLALILLAIAAIFFLWYALHLRAKNQSVMQRMEQIRLNFFTNITHEFRTPLTIILGFAKQLENDKIPHNETTKSLGKRIYHQGADLLDLINQLLDISKVKSDIGDSSWVSGNIIAYLIMITETFHKVAAQKNIELSFSHSENIIMMDMVPDYILKIMRNLISNAIKFTPNQGKINISAIRSANNLILKISDTGIGIPPKDLPHIFDAFYQGQNGSSTIGTGVGLSLVHQIIEILNGNIVIDSSQEVGTTFTITLPIKNTITKVEPFASNDLNILQPSDLLDNENIVNPQITQATKETDNSLPILLIVEDNPDISNFIATQLAKQYNIFFANNGEDGLNRAIDLIPDIIISDIMMPVMDGLEMCKQIRKNEATNHIPLIIVSAMCSEEESIKWIKAGVDAYLYKPFNAEELNARIEGLLESRRLLREKYSIALSKGTQNEVQLSRTSQSFINKFIDLIYQSITRNNTDVESLASKLCMSRSQLNRKIQAITGENTISFIIHIRIEKAKTLLDSSIDIPVGDIATECGFEDGAYFSRIFKQLCGLTPSQYRKRIKH